MDIEYQQALEIVKIFVSNQLGIAKNKLSEDTRIEEDVRIAGLDTIIFYEDFFTQFQIANPQDFAVEKYVTNENFILFRLIKSIFSASERDKLKVKNIMIRHLTYVAMRKRWFEE
ncbi:DUF1493 family protein [Hymenobacter glacieicola]|uniref:Uncharacterized protein n=1 Tax=Hymenobacter glacieicola TaxID=1562124 RepID=A0ABQ1WPD1_9BACT|nr:DUF1493 family protein [Hymenobacter glacieicola]GGG36088.1 hypothetical protein GCM10011378_10480 [Hymenobacter glacieicola]